MKTNVRTYDTIKFFRGRKRNNAEMLRLSDENRDFEYRRLLIEENELDLHVAFSKMIVLHWLAWSFLALAICFYQIPIMVYTLIGLSILSQIFSIKYKRFFQFVFRSYNLALNIVDSVIFTEYGIKLK